MASIQVGINYPWIKYGWDFGNPVTKWGNRAEWKSVIGTDLPLFKQLRIFAIRWFILGDGVTYGIGGNVPYPVKTTKGQEQWRFGEPPNLTKEFKEDFELLLHILQTHSIKLIPSLIDYQWCLPGKDKTKKGDLFPPGFVARGRSEIIINSSKRKIFLDRVLDPLLAITQKHTSAVYAWELINEPEWVTMISSKDDPTKRTIPLSEMLAFIREGVGRINSRGFRSTIGFAHYKSIPDWNRWSHADAKRGLGVTLHQFHYYPDPKKSPPLLQHNFSPKYPCFIGEFSTSAKHKPWPELKSQDVKSRLNLIEHKGYPAAFPWSVHGKKAATDWSSQVHRMIGRYTGAIK